MELVCIQCPIGCHLKVEKQGDEIHVEGNSCPRGKAYAINEMTCPVRTLTTTVEIEGGMYSRLPVISSQPIEKEKIMEVVEHLKNVKVQAPVHRNDVIVANVDGKGCNLVASRSMDRI